VETLLAPAAAAGARLKAAGATLAVAESSAGGLISAALLAVPGASAYFIGGAVVYTRQSRRVLLDIPDAALDGVPPSTEAYALMMARGVQARFGTTWGLAETGATGPTGNRYGYPAGHACLALAGPKEASVTLETGSTDRAANMRAFAAAAIELLDRALRG
jgi:nicotinamide-nucleotide amidase